MIAYCERCVKIFCCKHKKENLQAKKSNYSPLQWTAQVQHFTHTLKRYAGIPRKNKICFNGNYLPHKKFGVVVRDIAISTVGLGSIAGPVETDTVSPKALHR